MKILVNNIYELGISQLGIDLKQIGSPEALYNYLIQLLQDENLVFEYDFNTDELYIEGNLVLSSEIVNTYNPIIMEE